MRKLLPKKGLSLSVMLVVGVAALMGQAHFFRRHTATRAQPLRLVPADQHPPGENHAELHAAENARKVDSNAIPGHLVGRFPNAGNPHAIREQRYHFRLPLDPKPAEKPTPLDQSAGRFSPPNIPFGVAVNGVLFDPGTAEFWRGARASGWNYEALGGAVPLGVDANHAHVQPGGQYHYHGLPTGLLEELSHSKNVHSPLVGWAADGFPIYALYGYSEPRDATSKIVELRTSYRLKKGNRPGGREPDGRYDGAFVQDYEYEAGLGDLDECNGRECMTPEFPDGTYAYFLTEEWPVIPRMFRGKPVRLR